MAKKKTKTTNNNAVVKAAPAARGTKLTTVKQPRVNFRMDGHCTVAHMEYVIDVTTGSSAVLPDVKSFQVNPQRNTTFTWLSAMATRFEMYKFRKLKFLYKPSVGTAQGGYVAYGFDFDVLDEAPTKAVMLAWKYSTKGAAWMETSLDVSGDARTSTWRYCNNAADPNGDPRMDMLGALWLLTQGTGVVTSVGELFIEYEVEFKQPSYKVPSPLFGRITSQGINNNPTAPFLNTPIASGNMLLSALDATGGVINDIGKFLVEAAMFSTSAGFTTTPQLQFVAPPVTSPTASWTTSELFRLHNTTFGVASYLLDVLQPPVRVVFTNTTGGAGNITGSIRISTYNPSLG